MLTPSSQIVICLVCIALMAFYSKRNKQANEGKRVLEGHKSVRRTSPADLR